MNSPHKIGNYRWPICALLFFATTVNYIDRQILSLLKEILDKDLGWTNEQFGMVNSAFQAAYGLGLLGFGWFVDRFGTKVGYAVSIAAWSLAAAAHALVGSVQGFLNVRVALGLAESGNFPAAIKAVAVVSPPRAGLRHQYLQLGHNVGAIIAAGRHPLDRPALGLAGGVRRRGHRRHGVAGRLVALLQRARKDRKPRRSELRAHPQRRRQQRQPAQSPWLSLLGYRQTWSFIVAKFLTDPVWWFFLIWLPDYFKKTRGLDIKRSWILIVTIYAIVTVLSIFGGWITGYLASAAGR